MEESDYSFDDEVMQEVEPEESDFSFDDEIDVVKRKTAVSVSPDPDYQKSKKASSISTKPTNGKRGKSVKLVHYDSVQIPMPDLSIIDKLLSWRLTDENDEQSVEILVKYKYSSYLHAQWIPKAEIEKMSKTGKTRVKKFMESKPLYEIVWSEDEPFNPSFLKIDRIIDEGEMNGELYYLVKWCSLAYDESTWELESVVSDIDPQKITEFQTRRIIPKDKMNSSNKFKRPSAEQWIKLEESPIYKNGNQLRPYQLEGLNWLLYCWYHGNNSILADEMGLGKTVQSTAFINHLQIELNMPGPFLIITPLSTIGNWEREIRTWTDMNLVVFHGKDIARNLCVDSEFYFKTENGDIDPSIYKFDAVLTTYEMAMSGIAQLKPIKWRCCILDEAHKLKNKSSKISEMLKLYHFDHKILLTGTPLQNSLEELWSLLNFMSPEEFGDEKHFQKEYGGLSTAADVEKLQLLLKPLMLRRLKEDVEKTIPVKEETIVEVELTTIQKRWYRSILERNFSWLKQGSKKNNMPNLINTMMELRKCCIHPFLLKGAEDSICDEYKSVTQEQHFKVLVAASGKMVLIDKLLKKLKAGGHKVLLFSQMTKCLDIIQDYLKGMQYGFERIDGSVRGDLRQAAIDRFSSPNSESFEVCVRTLPVINPLAGGVGINLTIADTVIIFDSDWNPQNDLQAQARCHRIGQTKSVQIYRLVTRNTYERDMLDRASMKLGLDKAILQRMDAGSTIDSTETNQNMSSALSKSEVEELLKKGAYGAFMDDEASNTFCEEDIDQILERRTQKIRHDNSADKGSIFSKASFATSASDNIDINDPDFWDKVAQKAQFEIFEELDDQTLLIVNEPRNRKQVQRFGVDEKGSENEASDDEFPGIAGSVGDKQRHFNTKLGPDEPKLWTQTEKSRFERMLMLYGFEGIGKAVEQFPRRSIEDLRAVSRVAMRACLVGPLPLESDIINDINMILASDNVRLMSISPEFPGPFEDDIPYPHASPKQIAEFKSFLSTLDYRDHLQKKSKNLLARIQMLYTIREKIKPTKDTAIPMIPGNYPVAWWGNNEDRDLLIGILKHGYGQYDKIRQDSELCFYPKYFDEFGNLRIPPEIVEEITESTPEASELPNNPNQISKSHQDMLEHQESPRQTSPNPAQTLIDHNIPHDHIQPTLEGVVNEGNKELPIIEMEGGRTEMKKSAQQTGWFAWPGPADLGIRIRKIIAAFMRLGHSAARDMIRNQQAAEKSRQRDLKEQERIKLKENDMTRKDKQEFVRVLMSFGVEHDPENLEKRIWGRFKELSSLKKSDEALEQYYLKMYALAKEVIAKGDLFQKELKDQESNGITNLGSDTLAAISAQSSVVKNDDSENVEAMDVIKRIQVEGTGTPPELSEADKLRSTKFNPNLFKIENDGDVLAYEKAKRMLKRIEIMRTLREVVLPHPELEERILAVKKYQRTVLPAWWQLKYDKFYLHGVARWGLQRSDLIIDDPSLPFRKLYKEYKKLKGDIDETHDDERFWMKEHVATKRFELCVEAVLRPTLSSRTHPERADMSKQTFMSTRSKRATGNDGEDGEEVTSNDEGAPSNSGPKSLRLKLNFEDRDKESVPKKRKKKEQPDITSDKVTLEELFAFNKKLSSLYLKEYDAYKVKMMAVKIKQAQSERRKLTPKIGTFNVDHPVPVVAIEYSEGSDGEVVVSSKIVSHATNNDSNMEDSLSLTEKNLQLIAPDTLQTQSMPNGAKTEIAPEAGSPVKLQSYASSAYPQCSMSPKKRFGEKPTQEDTKKPRLDE